MTTLLNILFLSIISFNVIAEEILIDSRIKTSLYQNGIVYNLILKPNYQTIIEFAKNEEVELMAFGDSYGWDIKPMGNKFFIKPLEYNLKTNLQIFTNKNRSYLFDISSLDIEDPDIEDTVYNLKFFYLEDASDPSIKLMNRDKPERNNDINKESKNKIDNSLSKKDDVAIKKPEITNKEPVNKVTLELSKDKKINTEYSYSNKSPEEDNEKIIPLRVFDDGKKTYFQFRNQNYQVPLIYDVSRTGNETLLNSYVVGDFIVVDGVSAQFALRLKDDITGDYLTCVFRDSLLSKLYNL